MIDLRKVLEQWGNPYEKSEADLPSRGALIEALRQAADELEAARGLNARLMTWLQAADAALQFANQNMRPGLSGPHGDRWDAILAKAWNREAR